MLTHNFMYLFVYAQLSVITFLWNIHAQLLMKKSKVGAEFLWIIINV